MKFSTSGGSAIGLLSWSGGSLTGVTYAADPTLFGDLPSLGPAELTFSDGDRIYDFNGGVCVNTFLDNDERGLLKTAKTEKVQTENNDNWKQDDEKFADPKGDAKACAAVSWEQETWRDGNWRGVIRYEWLYKFGNETLITYALYDPMPAKSVENAMSWRTLYLDRDRKLAQGFYLYIDDNNKPALLSPTGSYWGFNLDQKKICRDQIVCTSDDGKRVAREFKWTWVKQDAGKDRFVDWSSNLPAILDKYFTRTDIKLDKFTALSREKGTWTER